jgi:hypothetical protein
MSAREQQSSILSEQELHLLASQPYQKVQSPFRIYSYKHKAKFNENPLYIAYSIEQLIFMLDTSPLGVVLVLPDSIESESVLELNKLIALLTQRNDILVFWLGRMPSMDTDIPAFIHCTDEHLLHQNIDTWHGRIKYLFNDWLAQYPVAFVTNNDLRKERHQADLKEIGLLNTSYFDATSSLTSIIKPKLLIIDLETSNFHLINTLKQLSNREVFPIIIIYGQRPKNIFHAVYSLVENSGFPVLASLNEIPNKEKWEQLFSSLFSKVYLKPWANEAIEEVTAYNLYHLESNAILAHFCVSGITLKQVSALPKMATAHYIITAQSIRDWFPDSIQSDIHTSLANKLQCDPSQLDLCIEHPEKILPTSLFFSTLVMARLAHTKVYWKVKNESHLLSEFIKKFPISDIILSESLSLSLLNEASELLLEFIEQAQLHQVNVIASLAPSSKAKEALSLYGIESVISI